MPVVATLEQPSMVPANRPSASNTKLQVSVEVKLPEKVENFAKAFEKTVANHPYFRRTWRENATTTAKDLGSKLRNAIVNRYGDANTDGTKSFFGMTEREGVGSVWEIMKRAVNRTPELVPYKKGDSDDIEPQEEERPKSTASAEEANRENLRLVTLQIDTLKSIDGNLKSLLSVVNELKKAGDEQSLEKTAKETNANNPSLFDSIGDFLATRYGLGNRTPKTGKTPTSAPRAGRRGVFSRVMNGARMLVTRASTSLSPIATNIGNRVGGIVSTGKDVAISAKNVVADNLGKGLTLAKSTAQGATEVAQNTFGLVRNQVAKTTSGMGTRFAETASRAGKGITSLAPNLARRIPLIGAVAGGGLALMDYNSGAKEIDEAVKSGAISKEKAQIMKSNLAKKSAGSAVGAGIGTAIGSVVGSVIPVGGTIIGGAIGGWLGEKIGSWVGEQAGANPAMAEYEGVLRDLEKLKATGDLDASNVKEKYRMMMRDSNLTDDEKAELTQKFQELYDYARKNPTKNVYNPQSDLSVANDMADLAQASEAGMARNQVNPTVAKNANTGLAINGAETYNNAFENSRPEPQTQPSNNNVTQVNQFANNTNVTRFPLTSRDQSDSLRAYRQSNMATVG